MTFPKSQEQRIKDGAVALYEHVVARTAARQGKPMYLDEISIEYMEGIAKKIIDAADREPPAPSYSGPGTYYSRYKKEHYWFYEVLGLAAREVGGEILVIYKMITPVSRVGIQTHAATSDGDRVNFWACPLCDFNQMIDMPDGSKRRRLERVDDGPREN